MKTLKIGLGILAGVILMGGVLYDTGSNAAQLGKKRAPRVFVVGVAKQKPVLQANLSRSGTQRYTFSREAEIVKPAKDALIEKTGKVVAKIK